MAFHKITYNEKYAFATLHNYACNFRCPVCSYKLHSGADGKPGNTFPKPEHFLTIEEIKGILASVPISKVNFMGGEPTCASELPKILDFVQNKLCIKTYLGHTNGSRIPMANLNGANVGLKAWDEKIHFKYTGKEKKMIFDNFANAFTAGLDLKANIVYVPELVELDQIEAVAKWLGVLSKNIPFHIMGYIPVPGQPYSKPTLKELNVAVENCRKYLNNVEYSHLNNNDVKTLYRNDDRFKVKEIS